ncbi:multicopper oxidase domain-containing protein [Rhodoferax lacus]|uniref:multicopper oxidase domain-containing protein n=1 Tax=Rhodoferax lacus TaxID=2184758 RepID=UPI0018F48623|nr:multicopper oxidase domain-containing protein [Rhodoferax lacus]
MKNKGTKGLHSNLRRSPVAHACLTFSMLMAASAAQAGAGWGVRGDTDAAGADIRVPTYYAHTPSGPRFNVPKEAAGYDNVVGTGKALRKFVDNLPGLRLPDSITAAGTLTDYPAETKYIPVAAAQRWPGDSAANVAGTSDYYEIAVVEYAERLHSDLKKPTLLRGYVQIKRGGGGVQLFYPNGTPIQIQSVNADGSLMFDAAGARVMENAFGFEKPHYLGPAIVATKGRATRLKFLNLLPVGKSSTDANGVVTRNGDLFLPVDETLPGAGYGPDGRNLYRQNRAMIHLHGGDNPWISDGTPHQWITPAGEANTTDPISLAGTIADADVLNSYLRGPSAQNVPDMPDPGPGAMTYYFPNGQSGRLEWYHDHSFGLTRLNVYAGMAAPYVLKDPVQDALLTSQGIPGEMEAIPLVIQDKTFVPDDIALQDARWNKTNTGAAKEIWGQAGDMWYPHVYELNQDPNNSVDGTNAVGRWDWGPYFWPVFPALYNLPTGAVDDVTLTPEAWMDTPLVNGVAYPKLAVEPKTYRFRILNAANDRMLNLSMFVADTQVSTINLSSGGTGYTAGQVLVEVLDAAGAVTSATAEAAVDATGAISAIRVINAGTGYDKNVPPSVRITSLDNLGSGAAATATVVETEVKMVPAVPQVASGIAACGTDASGAELPPTAAAPCWPSTWPTDGRDGGVPDPATVGPAFYQIGNEGGLLPKVAKIDATPMGYEYNRRSVTVLNTFTNGLFLGNAERADVLIDFSAYAGKKIILYSDAPAPVPAFDPRNDHWTGKPDEADAGSVETPQAGFGPNTRTVMQFVVGDTAAVPNPGVIAKAVTALPAVYASTQEAPLVGQGYYNNSVAGGAKSWSEGTSVNTDGTRAYAGIFTGTLQEPAFNYQPGSGSGLSVLLAPDSAATAHTGGLGYRTAPAVRFSAGTAQAVSSLRVGAFNVDTAGSGYTVAPRVTITNNVGAPGSGATAEATLKVVQVIMDNQGSGYVAAPKVTFSAPTSPPLMRNGQPTGSVQATGTATIVGGRVTGITITNAGKGYAGAPTVSIGAPAVGGRQAVAHSSGGVAEVSVVVSNPTKPNQAGGGGYARMADLTVTLSAPQLANGVAAAATPIGSVFDVRITNPGNPYATLPTISFTGGNLIAGGVAAKATASNTGSLVVKNKAIQELFDPTYGRMNATLGVELPFTSALVQTTIPLGYVDPATEQFTDGETQIWKITHNGVDAHPIHFHLMNVQVINRIGWDGTIKPPADNERGWKETLRFNPLEDVVVAMRPKKPVLAGFGLPNSVRAMDPSQPLGVPTGFTQVDTVTGNPADVVNKMVDYGWEYVWHCHILGHEENDFMRPLVFDAAEAGALAPTGLNLVGNKLTWVDNAQTEFKYTIETFTSGNGGVAADTITALANATGTTVTLLPPQTDGSYRYRVTAIGQNGSASTTLAVTTAPNAPTLLAFTTRTNAGVNLSWTDNSVAEAGFRVMRATVTNGVVGAFTTLNGAVGAANGTGTVTYRDTSAVANLAYVYKVYAFNAAGNSAESNVTDTVPAMPVPAAPSSIGVPTIARITGNFAQDRATVTWGSSDATATGYTVQYSLNGTNWVNGTTAPANANSASFNVVRLLTYYFRVQATNAAGGSSYVTTTTGVRAP